MISARAWETADPATINAAQPPQTSFRMEWRAEHDLFMHEYSQGYLPFYGQRDSLGYDYAVEERNALLNSRQYCINNPNARAAAFQTAIGSLRMP